MQGEPQVPGEEGSGAGLSWRGLSKALVCLPHSFLVMPEPTCVWSQEELGHQASPPLHTVLGPVLRLWLRVTCVLSHVAVCDEAGESSPIPVQDIL